MTDLGLNILAGADEVSGLYRFNTGQRIMSDLRMSLVNYHSSHSGHAWSGDNAVGESGSWPSIVPFNDGFINFHQIYVYGPSDPDWSPLSEVRYKIDCIDADGDILWTRNYTAADFNLRVTAGPSDFQTTNSYVSMSPIAGNGNSRVLVVKRQQVPVSLDDEYVWIDFDADGDFTETTAFTRPYTESWSDSWMGYKQIKSGSGYIVAHNADIYSSGIKVYTLDADLDLVDNGLVLPANIGTFSRRIVSQWNGVNQPHLVELAGAGTPTGWSARAITFDGVNPASVGSAFTGNFDRDVWNPDNYTGASSVMGVVNWSTGSGTKPADYWSPSDGGASVVAPNPNNMEWVYGEDWTTASAKNLSMQFSIVADWYGATPQTNPYNGDTFAYLPSPLRFNFYNESTDTSAAVDILPALPSDVTYADMGGGFAFPTLYDWDMDDAGYTVVHPESGLICAYTVNYWTERGPVLSGTGPDYGDNLLVSYWIVEPLSSAPPPATTMPSWWNAFGSSGSSGGGVAPPGEADCARLGSGENVAFLYDRGGARPIALIPPADMGMIRWNRKRDDMSNCTMLLVSPGSDCCQVVREMQAGRHEIVVFRNGERVWEGPLTRISYKADSVEVEAHDVIHYTSRTIMRSAYDNRYRKKGSRVGPVTKRAQVILQNELQRKERLGYNLLKFLDVRTNPQTTRTSRYTPAYYSTVFDELEYLGAKLSLDYTTLGRRIIVNDVHDVLGRLPMLTDKDFSDELIVTSYGMELRTRSAVTDGEGHWAAVGGVDPYYGEVEFVDTTYGEEAKPATTEKPTKEELAAMMREMTSQAQRNLTGRYPIPTIVRIPDNTRLSPEAPVTINELIPGVRVPIRATLACLELQQEQKLDYMQCEQTTQGESVTITLSPAPGTTPWDDSSETPEDEEETSG